MKMLESDPRLKLILTDQMKDEIVQKEIKSRLTRGTPRQASGAAYSKASSQVPSNIMDILEDTQVKKDVKPPFENRRRSSV